MFMPSASHFHALLCPAPGMRLTLKTQVVFILRGDQTPGHEA